MSFLADLHIHSHFSIATSKDCNPENLFLWACLKGVTIVGTGDFTHPGWLDELSQKLIPAGEGLYRLRPEYEKSILKQIPRSCHSDIRFVLSAEISSIYKKGGKTRKIHNCIIVPTLDEARAISCRLDEIGNIKADGRPILGLDSRDLLEIMLENSPEGIFIPAHIWTPHFSLLGAYSGFDTVEECFEDLSGYIWALETGLSSDPPMNWRLSGLDKYKLVSNSDAHSPKNLAREANIFNCDLSFPAIRSAIKERGIGGFLGTIEFFPEEGKYHYNGHRNCGIRVTPEQTRDLGGICPKCGKPLTLGVMHRVVQLADRPHGFTPKGAPSYKSLIPLPEIIADYLGCGKNTKRVQQIYFNLLQRFGPEWKVLTATPIEDLRAFCGRILAEGIDRIRGGRAEIKPGFDGEYGTISIFSQEDRLGHNLQISLFKKVEAQPVTGEKDHLLSKKQREQLSLFQSEISGPEPPHMGHGPKHTPNTPGPEVEKTRLPEIKKAPFDNALNPEQRKAVHSGGGPVLVIAGPGTGKTRTLISRMEYLINEMAVEPKKIMAITFTNKAAKQISERLLHTTALFGTCPFIGTFHQYCLRVLREYGKNPGFTIFHTFDSLGILEDIMRSKKITPPLKPRECLQRISNWKAGQGKALGDRKDGKAKNALEILYEEYQRGLDNYNAYDYDDLLLKTVELLRENKEVYNRIHNSLEHILVDEFQDVNPIQYSLIKLLANESGEGLFVIGDPNQAIYGFRGADNTLFYRLEKEYKGSVIHTLEVNYRSTPQILDAAISVIAKNRQPTPLALRSSQESGPLIEILELPSEKMEAIAIVKEITSLMGGIDMLQAHAETTKKPKPGKNCNINSISRENNNHFNTLSTAKTANPGILSQQQRENGRGCYTFSDFAILFRTGAQADILEECLLKEGIPYRLTGQQGIMESPIVRQILALLRWSIKPYDEYSLLTALELPIFPIAKKIKSTIIDLSIYDKGGGSKPDPETQRAIETLLGYKTKIKEATLLDSITMVVTDLHDSGISRVNEKAIKKLLLLAQEFGDTAKFLESVSLYREGDISWRGEKSGEKSEMVSLMTLHAAKGLEFPVVFICGCEDGLIPYRHLLTNKAMKTAKERAEAIEVPDMLSNTAIIEDQKDITANTFNNATDTLQDKDPARGCGSALPFVTFGYTRDQEACNIKKGGAIDPGDITLENADVQADMRLEKTNNPGEERRIFYVGMTRAKDRLYLSRTKNRMIFGKKQKTSLSPFIQDIPAEFYTNTKTASLPPPKPKVKQLSLW